MSDTIYVRPSSVVEPGALADLHLSSLLAGALIMLALGIVYVVGVEPMPSVHNAFHDLRHASGFPCH